MEFSLFDTIKSHVDNFSDRLYTCTPAVVDSYDPKSASVTCTPSIYEKDKDGVLIKGTQLEDVPLHFSATNNIKITFPVEKGDSVLLIFAHNDTENWLENNDNFAPPKTLRKHNLNDAFAIPWQSKHGSRVVEVGTERDLNIQYKDSYFRVKEDGRIEAATANGNSISLLTDGSIDAVVADKFSVSNGTGELVDWVHTLCDELGKVTVNTVYGQSPILNKAQVETLKSSISSMVK